MQILLRGMRPSLADWEARPYWPGTLTGPEPGDHRDVYEREVAREPPGPPSEDGPFLRVASAIRRYEIFPPELVTGVLRRTPIQPGDTVGICYHVPLLLDLFFAARVFEIFDGLDGCRFSSGFRYRTLLGHPELGEERFAVDKDVESGVVRVELRAWSRPGTLMARAFAPIVRHLQVQAGYSALAHLSRVAQDSETPLAANVSPSQT